MPADDEALRYYFDELTYLRTAGAEFAKTHDKVAANLDFSGEVSADPHVERLIESFAFLTGRIQRNLDAEFPQLTNALLGVLAPQLVQPVPPTAIARFAVDPVRAKVPTGYLVAKHTPLVARSTDGLPCRFRTCYPVHLWPLEVEDAAIEPAREQGVDEPGISSVLRLRLRCLAGKMSDLAIDRLRFFIDGSTPLASALYDAIFTGVRSIQLRAACTEGDAPVDSIRLPRGSLRQVGFRVEDEVVPSPPNSHPGYRLLQEYFHFPEKFRFFELRNFDRRPAGEVVDVLLLLDRASPRLSASKENFVLGCTPVVNLFRKTTEPVRVDHQRLEYRLVADARRERTTEIHSIESVSAVSNPEEKAAQYQPFYSARHSWDDSRRHAYWISRRAATGREDVPGTDLWLSFLNLDFARAKLTDEVIYAHTLCTNRRLALELKDRAELQIESPAPTHSISCIVRPTAPALPALGGNTVWRLISNLSLNRLSLEASGTGVDSLREILRIYALNDSPSVRRQIDGIRDLRVRHVVRRFGPPELRSFRTGSEITLDLDPGMYAGSSPIMLASVLRHFLAMHTSLNSFVQVLARRAGDDSDEAWKKWPPLAGDQPVV